MMKLDHCVIHVSDWEVSNPFYRDVLGAELVDRGHGTWAYRFGTEQLNVHGPGVSAAPVARIPVAPGNSDLCCQALSCSIAVIQFSMWYVCAIFPSLIVIRSIAMVLND